MTDLLKPDDLRKIADDLDMAKAKKMMEHMKAEEAERDKLREAFNSQEIHPDVKERVNNTIRRAAEQGNRQVLALTFPAKYCNDQGRRINNMEPDWPQSLEGFAKKAYQYYMVELKPLGYKLHAEIMDYPGGMPGNVGIYLSWDR